MKKPKELTNEWIDKMAKELGLDVCYVPIGGSEEKDEVIGHEAVGICKIPQFPCKADVTGMGNQTQKKETH